MTSARSTTTSRGDQAAAGGTIIGRRLGFLDALRGLAVLIVLVQHLGELQSEAISEFTTSWLQLGQLGVTVFFLCSGFIIPATLERGDSLKGFWTSRFFRLYPMYWVSLALAYLLFAVGRPVAPGFGVVDWLANVTMLQQFLGREDAVGPYWTLAWEMLFYAIMSVLFLLGIHRRSTLWAAAACGGILALCLFGLATGARLPVGSFSLSCMFIGTVFYRWYSGVTPLRVLLGCVVGILLSGAALLVINHHNGFRSDEAAPIAMYSAWVMSFAVLALGIWLWQNRPAPRILTEVGRISYSVYLIHGIVLAAVPTFAPCGLSVVVWLVVIFGISLATYHFVERPAIAAGRRLGHRAAPTRQEPQPMAPPGADRAA